MKVLLSIKPVFAEKIFWGTKKFEYRKSLFKDKNVTTIVVYVSTPIRKIIGEFKINRIIKASPIELWEETADYSGISKAFFDEYFNGKQTAFAIEVGDVLLYEKPLHLNV